MAQHFCQQPGESVAKAGTFSRHLRLAFGQFAAAAGEDGRSTGETCAVLLAALGGRTPDASAVRGDVAEDRAVAASSKLADRPQRSESEPRRPKEHG